jgi:hypothetical protein
MSEQIAYADQQAMNHFISDSPWDAQAVMKQVAQDVDQSFTKGTGKKGLLIDEIGPPMRWMEEGRQAFSGGSPSVLRQYRENR